MEDSVERCLRRFDFQKRRDRERKTNKKHKLKLQNLKFNSCRDYSADDECDNFDHNFSSFEYNVRNEIHFNQNNLSESSSDDYEKNEEESDIDHDAETIFKYRQRVYEESTDYSSESEVEFCRPKKETDFIYDGSRMTVKDFNIFFMWLCNKLKLSESKRHFLFKSIKTTYPSINNLPSTFDSLQAQIDTKKDNSKVLRLCSVCYAKKNDKDKSSCDSCTRKNISSNQQSKRELIDAIVYDYKEQLKSIISKNWVYIKSFKNGKVIFSF